MRILSVIFLLVFLLPIVTVAGETPQSGEALFLSTTLGSNGKSCASCHPQGRGLEKVSDFDDVILREMINFCIRDALKGEMLPEGARELEVLATYVRRYQKAN